MSPEERSFEQITEHYLVERELADRLRRASRPERLHLYATLYDELYRRVPHHTQLLQKSSPAHSKRSVSFQMRNLGPFLKPDLTFLEIGPGDCALALELTKRVKRVYAVDVSEELSRDIRAPENFQIILSDGISVPVPPQSVDLAYSNQLIEHLHPEDAAEQLQNIHRALAPGGVYLCATPNRLSGPHDISKYFSSVASGFHLKEYTIAELSALFRQVGFSRVRVHFRFKGLHLRLPTLPAVLGERMLCLLPQRVRKAVASSFLVTALLGFRLIGNK